MSVYTEILDAVDAALREAGRVRRLSRMAGSARSYRLPIGAPSRLRLGVVLCPAPSMGRSPVVVRAPSPWKFRIPPAIPGGTLLVLTTLEEQGRAARREGGKPESKANGKEPI